MATTEHFYTGDNSQTDFSFTFPYLKTADIKVHRDNVATTEYTLPNSTTVRFNTAPGIGVDIHIFRDTDVDTAKATYAAGSSVRAVDLNNNHDQSLYSLQEHQGQLIQTAGIRDGAVNSAKILDGTIVNADINASAAIAGSKLVAATTSVPGSMSAADKTKLDGIETSATADQTNAEIRAAVEAASDSNVFTDADHSKLNGIEASATADQTNAEIRAAVEAASDSNVFTDADHAKLAGISASAGATTFAGLSDTPANFSGAGGYTVKVNSGANALEFVDSTSDVVGDTTPQLGGDLDVNGNEIISSATDGAIELNPNGSGNINLKTAVGGTTNLTSGGDVIFSSGVTNAICQWDYNEYQLEFWDGVKASFGSSEDLEIWHDATNNQIKGNNGKIVVSTTAGNSDIEITPHGTGDVVIDGLKYPQADGSAGQVLKTDGSAQLSWTNAASEGTDVKSTGESGGTKFLREDGDGTCSWQTVSSGPSLANDANNRVITGTGSGLNGEANLTFDGSTLEVAGDIKLSDDDLVYIGTGNDLSMRHNGSHSYITNATGQLIIQGNGDDVVITAADDVLIKNQGTEHAIECKGDGAVDIYHNGSKKFSTTSDGVLVPFIKVEVGGDVNGSVWNRTDANEAWVSHRFYTQNNSSGHIQVNAGSVTYSTSSDYRLKENIVDLTGAITRVKTLKPKRFNFKLRPADTLDGFLAHEVTTVPEATTGTKDEVDSDGNPVYQGIDQSKIVPLLTAALQEAIAKIETLETKVATLESA